MAILRSQRLCEDVEAGVVLSAPGDTPDHCVALSAGRGESPPTRLSRALGILAVFSTAVYFF